MKTTKIKNIDRLGVVNTRDADGEYGAIWKFYTKKGKLRAEIELSVDQLYILKDAIERSLFEFAKHDAGKDGYVIVDDFMDRSDKN